MIEPAAPAYEFTGAKFSRQIHHDVAAHFEASSESDQINHSMLEALEESLLIHILEQDQAPARTAANLRATSKNFRSMRSLEAFAVASHPDAFIRLPDDELKRLPPIMERIHTLPKDVQSIALRGVIGSLPALTPAAAYPRTAIAALDIAERCKSAGKAHIIGIIAERARTNFELSRAAPDQALMQHEFLALRSRLGRLLESVHSKDAASPLKSYLFFRMVNAKGVPIAESEFNKTVDHVICRTELETQAYLNAYQATLPWNFSDQRLARELTRLQRMPEPAHSRGLETLARSVPYRNGGVDSKHIHALLLDAAKLAPSQRFKMLDILLSRLSRTGRATEVEKVLALADPTTSSESVSLVAGTVMTMHGSQQDQNICIYDLAQKIAFRPHGYDALISHQILLERLEALPWPARAERFTQCAQTIERVGSDRIPKFLHMLHKHAPLLLPFPSDFNPFDHGFEQHYLAGRAQAKEAFLRIYDIVSSPVFKLGGEHFSEALSELTSLLHFLPDRDLPVRMFAICRALASFQEADADRIIHGMPELPPAEYS